MDNNAGPVLDNPGVQYCSAGQYVALNLRAFDQSSDNLTFSETGLPDGLHLDANNGVITGIVTDDAVSTTPDDVSVTVTDGLGNHSTVEFDWCVALSSDENDVLAGVFGIVDFEAIRRTRTIWFFEGRVIGAAPGVVTIQLGGLPSLIASASFNVNADGTFVVSETLGANEYGTATALATDSASNQSNLAAAMVRNHGSRWRGTSADAGPVLDNPGVQYCSAGQYVIMIPSLTDGLGQDLSFVASNLPDGLTIDQKTGIIRGTIADDAVTSTSDQVTITMTDSQSNTATVQFDWIVTPAPLTVQGVSQISGIQSADTGTLTLATFTTVDVNSQASDFTATVFWGDGSLHQATVTASNSGFTVSDDHTYDRAGTLFVSVVISNVNNSTESLFAEDTVVVAASPVSLINPGAQINVHGETITSLQITAQDTTNGTLTYSVLNLPAGLSMDSSGVISGTITANNGLYNVTVTATDGTYSGSQTFTWLVKVSSVSWVGGGDGVSWTDPLNWTGDDLPGANDNVTIGAGYSVVLDAEEATTVSNLTCMGSLTIDSVLSVQGVAALVGEITVNANLVLSGGGEMAGSMLIDEEGAVFLDQGNFVAQDGAQVNGPGLLVISPNGNQANLVVNAGNTSIANIELQTGGTISGAGTLNITTILTWNGGSMTGTGTTVINASAVFTGATKNLTERAIVIGFDACVLFDQGTLAFTQGALITNLGFFHLSGNNLAISSGTGNNWINNAGTITKTDCLTTDVTTIAPSVENTWEVVVEMGILTLTSYTQNSIPGLSESAVLQVETQGEVRCSQMRIWNGSIEGGGTVRIVAPIPGGQASLIWLGGSMNGTGILLIDQFSSMSIQGDLATTDTFQIVNYGQTNWINGSIELGEGTMFVNSSRETFSGSSESSVLWS